MPDSILFILLWTARWGTKAEKAAALADATVYLRSLPSHDAGNQLLYRGRHGWRVLHLLPLSFLECEQAAPFLLLAIERGRESRGTTALMALTGDSYGKTPLHHFARCCPDLSLTKMVLREHPPSLTVLTHDRRTPLRFAEDNQGITPKRAVFFRATAAAFSASDFVALEALCGSSPYLAREISRQAIALRAAVAICLDRLDAAPSALISCESGVALAMLGRVRAADGAGHLLRRVLEYVGPYAVPFDADWMEKGLKGRRRRNDDRKGGGVVAEQAAAIKELTAANEEQAVVIKEQAVVIKEQVVMIKLQAATISRQHQKRTAARE